MWITQPRNQVYKKYREKRALLPLAHVESAPKCLGCFAQNSVVFLLPPFSVSVYLSARRKIASSSSKGILIRHDIIVHLRPADGYRNKSVTMSTSSRVPATGAVYSAQCSEPDRSTKWTECIALRSCTLETSLIRT